MRVNIHMSSCLIRIVGQGHDSDLRCLHAWLVFPSYLVVVVGKTSADQSSSGIWNWNNTLCIIHIWCTCNFKVVYLYF